MYPDRTLGGMMIGMRTMMTLGSVLSSPVVADGAVYFGSTDGKCTRFVSVSGEQAWRGQVPRRAAEGAGSPRAASRGRRLSCVAAAGARRHS